MSNNISESASMTVYCASCKFWEGGINTEPVDFFGKCRVKEIKTSWDQVCLRWEKSE